MGARVIVCAPPTLLPTRIEEMGVRFVFDHKVEDLLAEVIGRSNLPERAEYKFQSSPDDQESRRPHLGYCL
jgi:hypothetical protein